MVPTFSTGEADARSGNKDNRERRDRMVRVGGVMKSQRRFGPWIDGWMMGSYLEDSRELIEGEIARRKNRDGWGERVWWEEDVNVKESVLSES